MQFKTLLALFAFAVAVNAQGTDTTSSAASGTASGTANPPAVTSPPSSGTAAVPPAIPSCLLSCGIVANSAGGCTAAADGSCSCSNLAGYSSAGGACIASACPSLLPEAASVTTPVCIPTGATGVVPGGGTATATATGGANPPKPPTTSNNNSPSTSSASTSSSAAGVALEFGLGGPFTVLVAACFALLGARLVV